MTFASGNARSCVSVQNLALLFVCVSLSACGGPGLAPEYSPQGVFAPIPTGPIQLTVVDRIENSAALPSESSSLLGARRNARGVQMICAACAYQFDVPPADLTKRFLLAALHQPAAAVGSAKKLEVRILQFEFFEPKAKRGAGIHMEGRITLRAIVTANGVVVADRTRSESGSYDFGLTVLAGEVEENVAATLSSAVENLIADPQIRDALLR
jgi:hypothetical protein